MTSQALPTFVWKAIASRRKGPGARSRHGLVYDRRAKATILYGGMIQGPAGGLLSDTWEFCDGEWSLIGTRDDPGLRDRVVLAYDERRRECVLFGGQGRDGEFFRAQSDTWTYADDFWRRCRTRAAPPARCGHALACDEEAGVLVLFGGAPDPGLRPLKDTWLFDAGSWQPVSGPGPPPRRHAALAYDPDLGGCVLNGGSDDDAGTRPFGDTWLFRDGAWTRLPDCFDTVARYGHALAYHWAARRLVMFGGRGGEHVLLVREQDGWRPAEDLRLPPRHLHSPLAWDESLDGLICHGGEAPNGERQFDTTWVLRLARTAKRTGTAKWPATPSAAPEPEPLPAASGETVDPAPPPRRRPPARVNCNRCDRSIDIRADYEEPFVRCPKCGSFTTLHGAEAGPGYGCEEPFKLCPRCGLELPAKAVLCQRCGYDYRTGQVVNTRRAVKPIAHHWGGNLPLRLALAGVLLPLGIPLLFLWLNLAAAAAVLAAWVLFVLALAGTFPTLSLRRHRHGGCTLQTRQWFGFIPLPSRTHLLDREVMRLESNAQGSGLATGVELLLGDSILPNTFLFPIAVIPFRALLFLCAMLSVGPCVLTLARDRGAQVERTIIYRCRSARRLRAITDTICDLARLSYS